MVIFVVVPSQLGLGHGVFGIFGICCRVVGTRTKARKQDSRPKGRERLQSITHTRRGFLEGIVHHLNDRRLSKHKASQLEVMRAPIELHHPRPEIWLVFGGTLLGFQTTLLAFGPCLFRSLVGFGGGCHDESHLCRIVTQAKGKERLESLEISVVVDVLNALATAGPCIAGGATSSEAFALFVTLVVVPVQKKPQQELSLLK